MEAEEVGSKEECAPGIMSTLLFNENLADVIFIVDDQRVPAHSNILAASSEYFRAMFYGFFSETKRKEIHINDRVDCFKFLIQYIYKGLTDMTGYDVEFLMETVIVANKYLYSGLKDLIERHVMRSINMKNFAEILNCIQKYQSDDVYKFFLELFDETPSKILHSQRFKLLSKEVVSDLIKRDSFGLDELDIFKAVFCWSKTHTKQDLNFVLPNIRFTLMQISDLRGYITKTGVLKKSQIESIIKEIKTLKTLPFRDGNFHRNQLVYNCPPNFFDIIWENDTNVPLNKICIKLPSVTFINNIEIDISCWSNLKKTTEYYIEISRDAVEWKRIIDYRKFRCFFKQHLSFEVTPVNYIFIRFMRYFICRNIKARYSKWQPTVVNGVIGPDRMFPFYNFQMNVEEIKKGYVKIVLSQPVYINCIYLMNYYKKYKITSVETSINDKIYKKLDIIAGKLDCWERVDFKSRTVLFIKLKFTPKKTLTAEIRVIFLKNIKTLTHTYNM